VCSGQSRLAEIRSGEHRAVEICLSEVGTEKVRSAQVRFPDDCGCTGSGCTASIRRPPEEKTTA